jgi:hypothetical protein
MNYDHKQGRNEVMINDCDYELNVFDCECDYDYEYKNK